MNVKKSILWRVAICFLAMVVFAVWVAVEMFVIQLVEGEAWLSQSDSFTIIRQDISPARGNIYSDNGALLATSMPIYEVRFDATIVPADTFRKYVDELALRLSRLFPDYPATYYRKELSQARNNGNRYLLIRRNVNYNQLKEMKTWPVFCLGRYRGGFITDLTTKRVRPAGKLAFRTIGYHTKDNPGVGLERAYNEDLGGQSGKRLAQRISGGYRPLNDENLIEPRNGRDVHTTIDIDFQEIAHLALSKTIVKQQADHGCVVVMEVKTGAIKAIVNLKLNEDGSLTESYNYAIGESYEPGSVFKVFSAMAVLEDELLKPEDSIDLYYGYREFFGKPMRDSHKGESKKATFKQAFAHSSNVAFSSVIFDYYSKDPSKYIGHLKKLDLHSSTGIEILGEPQPFLNQPSSSSWSNLSLPWLAIGYENRHTPLQLLSSYNAIINKGRFASPYLVSQIRDAGIVVKDYSPSDNLRRVCSEQTAETILDFTRETVQNGTASNIKSSVLNLAGKTGTAQIAGSGGYQEYRQYNASFMGHFPAENPEYSVIVMINRPSLGIFYASWVAAPVFKELAEKIYTISVKKEQEQDTSFFPPFSNGFYTDMRGIGKALGINLEDENEAVMVKVDPNTLKSVALKSKPGKMPSVIGMGARDAVYMLENQGLKVKLKGYGQVREQHPAPGTSITKGNRVYLRLEI